LSLELPVLALNWLLLLMFLLQKTNLLPILLLLWKTLPSQRLLIYVGDLTYETAQNI
jgi:hypothetical protein